MTVLPKLLTLLPLALLAACTQSGLNLGQGFGLSADVSGAAVVVQAASASRAAQASVTQPDVTFHARPQSVGFAIDHYQLSVRDAAGAPYGGTDGTLQRSFSAQVQPGFRCVDASGAATTPGSCAPQAAQASAVDTALGTVPMLSSALLRAITDDCVQDGVCPTLTLSVTFSGVDDAGRPQSVQVSAAPLTLTLTQP